MPPASIAQLVAPHMTQCRSSGRDLAQLPHVCVVVLHITTSSRPAPRLEYDEPSRWFCDKGHCYVQCPG